MAPAGDGPRRRSMNRHGGENSDYVSYPRALQYPRHPACLHFPGLLHNAQNAPRLRLGELARGLDLHQVTGLALVVLVVRVVLVRLDHHLAVDRVLRTPLDEHGDGLVHLVAGDTADDRLHQRLARFRRLRAGCFVAGLRVHPIAPCLSLPGTTLRAAACCASSVRTRAMPRRTSFSFAVFVSCCVARCMRRPNCSLSSASSSVCSSAAFLPASVRFESVLFIVVAL